MTQYQVDPEGPVGLTAYVPADTGHDASSVAIRRLLAHSYGNLFERGYGGIFQRALDNQELLAGANARGWVARFAVEGLDVDSGVEYSPQP